MGVKTNHRTNKGEIRHVGWEGVPVYNAEAFWEIASLGCIVEELLQRRPREQAKMEASVVKPGCVC